MAPLRGVLLSRGKGRPFPSSPRATRAASPQGEPFSFTLCNCGLPRSTVSVCGGGHHRISTQHGVFMEQYVGLDISQAMTHLCVIDSKGKKLWQGKCQTKPEDIAEVIRAKAPTAAIIGMESGSLSTWLYHALN